MSDVLMPRLSDTMTEGTLTQWFKREGDTIARGDVLAEVETDKATMEIEAYDAGVLTRILIAAGESAPIGQPIAVIDGSDDEPPGTVSAGPAAAAVRVATGEVEGTASPTVTTTPAVTPARVRISPLAAAIAREHGVDLTAVTGTGPDGRIVRADIETVLAATRDQSTGPVPPAVAAGSAAVAAVAPDDEQIPLTRIRRVTARRLTESAAVPHFHLTATVDATILLHLLGDLNAEHAEAATKFTVTDLLIRACAITLAAHPQVNASWGGDHLVRHRHIHVGVAVALEDGLIVPVVRDADRKGISQIATEAHALADRARTGHLRPDEVTGGTFTISNLGMFGIDHFTAVINPPEAAILAVGTATERPAVRQGRLVASTIMKLTLSIDHRVLDGAKAAVFLRDLTQLLEHPLRIFA